MVASVGCSLFLVGFLSRKPLSQMQRNTFLPLHHAATLSPSVDWGLTLPGPKRTGVLNVEIVRFSSSN